MKSEPNSSNIIRLLFVGLSFLILMSGCSKSRSLRSTTHVTHYVSNEYVSPKHGFYNAKLGTLHDMGNASQDYSEHYSIVHHAAKHHAPNLIFIKHVYFYRKFNSKTAEHQYLNDGLKSKVRDSDDAGKSDISREKTIQYVPKQVHLATKYVNDD